MKFLSYFFALALVFSSVSCENLIEENTSVSPEKALLEVQEILGSFTAEENKVLKEGLIALAEGLKTELENSEAYLKASELLKLKGLDISFFVNIVQARNVKASVEILEDLEEENENEELFALD